VSPSSITLLASSQINQDQLRSNSSSPTRCPPWCASSGLTHRRRSLIRSVSPTLQPLSPSCLHGRISCSPASKPGVAVNHIGGLLTLLGAVLAFPVGFAGGGADGDGR
jgi:hypothetical protein